MKSIITLLCLFVVGLAKAQTIQTQVSYSHLTKANLATSVSVCFKDSTHHLSVGAVVKSYQREKIVFIPGVKLFARSAGRTFGYMDVDLMGNLKPLNPANYQNAFPRIEGGGGIGRDFSRYLAFAVGVTHSEYDPVQEYKRGITGSVKILYKFCL